MTKKIVVGSIALAAIGFVMAQSVLRSPQDPLLSPTEKQSLRDAPKEQDIPSLRASAISQDQPAVEKGRKGASIAVAPSIPNGEGAAADAFAKAKTLSSFSVIQKGLQDMGFKDPHQTTRYHVKNFVLSSGKAISIMVVRNEDEYSLFIGSTEDGSAKKLSASSSAAFLDRTRNLDLIRSEIDKLTASGAQPAALEDADTDIALGIRSMAACHKMHSRFPGWLVCGHSAL